MADDRWRAVPAAARAAVAELLETDSGVRRLTHVELETYSRRRPVAGWRVTLPETCGSRRLDLLLPADFPWAKPVPMLVDRPPFGEWAHIERDGLICLLNDGATVDASNPRGVARHILVEAATIVAELSNGGLRDDLLAEFRSYWPDNEERRAVVSICDPKGPSRPIRCWTGRDHLVLADSDEAMVKWLENRGRDGSRLLTTRPAVLAVLDAPPMPEDYPNDGIAMLGLLDRVAPDAAALTRSFISEETESLVVALCAETDRGPAMVATILDRPRPPHGARTKRPDPLVKGFRAGRVPTPTLVRRFASGNAVKRAGIERADASWVHGRNGGDGFSDLRRAHVAFVGCGSLGSPVVRLLAQAGLGAMTFIDPDVMGWSNLGRHELGAGEVGHYKAVAMARRIRRDLPHIRSVEAVTSRIETVLTDRPEMLRHVDAIVSTTGDWSSNSALQAWADTSEVAPPLVLGWLEPYACAGHAVVLCQPKPCLRCGFDATGTPLFRVTDWERATTRREPACGASFQPYGATEAHHSAVIVAETILDLLLGRVSGSTHRIFAVRSEVLIRNGGRWTLEWLSLSPQAAGGGLTLERLWGTGAPCTACDARRAA